MGVAVAEVVDVLLQMMVFLKTSYIYNLNIGEMIVLITHLNTGCVKEHHTPGVQMSKSKLYIGSVFLKTSYIQYLHISEMIVLITHLNTGCVKGQHPSNVQMSKSKSYIGSVFLRLYAFSI